MVADDATLCYVFKFQEWLQCASCKFLTCHIDEFQFFLSKQEGSPPTDFIKVQKRSLYKTNQTKGE
jgi:hypothetical protein